MTTTDLKVYGDWPAISLMVGRAQRDRFDVSSLRRAIQTYRGRYRLRVWARRSTHDVLEVVGWNGMEPVYRREPGWITYSVRRDGRIQSTGRAVPELEIELVPDPVE
jgi:hypothetical protein